MTQISQMKNRIQYRPSIRVHLLYIKPNPFRFSSVESVKSVDKPKALS